jgi:hypothetical protein
MKGERDRGCIVQEQGKAKTTVQTVAIKQQLHRWHGTKR